MATKKEKKSQLSCSFANVPGAGDCLAILLFLGYLWNNQFNWADDCLVPVLLFWLKSLFSAIGISLCYVAREWHAFSKPRFRSSSPPLVCPCQSDFWGICLELLQEKRKNGKGHQNKVEKLLKDGRNRGWQKVQTLSYKVNKIWGSRKTNKQK